jgi:hypothetical protein
MKPNLAKRLERVGEYHPDWVESLAENRAIEQYCCGRKEYYFFEDHSVLVHERCCWYTDTVGQASRDIEDYFAENNFAREMFA